MWLARANRSNVNRLPRNGGGPERTNAGNDVGAGATRNCSVCGPAKLTGRNRNGAGVGAVRESEPARPGMIPTRCP